MLFLLALLSVPDLSGWFSVLSWQCGTAGCYLIEGSAIQAIATITYPGYAAAPYQTYLIMLAMVTFSAIFNTVLAKHLPVAEGAFLLGHVLVFGMIIWVLAILSPKVPAKDVFTSFYTRSGYSSTGISVLVGQTAAIWTLIGSDTSAHMVASPNVLPCYVY